MTTGSASPSQGVPRLSVYIAASLDGYIATENDDLTWLESAGAPGEDYGFDAFLATIDLVVMGRGTYDHIASFDPLPYGDRPVQVFTHRAPADRPGVRFGSWTPEQAMADWRAAGLRRVYVDGGQLIGQFLAEGMIDDLTITFVPLLLGSGRRLFHPVPRRAQLQLTAARSYPSGMMQVSYQRL